MPVTYKGHYILCGDKLYTMENTKGSCEVLAAELELFGYLCRVDYNKKTNSWFVDVI